MSQKTPDTSNRLANESSPYLRQHAENPVDWYPWGEEALKKAKEENKPILLSIGYSSCHWCHVMAHESFENDTIADYMNKHFVNIKLDREQRPDIDQIYMEAIQNMGLRGGWPLNVFLTPDQKPFYGGTYFPPEQWQQLLKSVNEAYEKNYDKLYESASKFAESIQQSEILKYGLGNNGSKIENIEFDTVFQVLSKRFDVKWGGIKKAPKFPMPSIWQYLAHYYDLSKNEQAKEHFLFTLDKIAAGGIYDQIGGGFARYSVDAEWHVPHFEKMLYDNGQLLSLYATGYKLSKKPTYLRIMKQTAEWLEREMMNEKGGFYSALDADSEGIEGKYYVWTFEEVKRLAGDRFSLIAEYYDVSKEGNWEGKNILRRLESDQNLADELSMDVSDLRELVKEFDKKALEKRKERIPPGLDDKIISGWNGLMLSGLSEAYQATHDSLFLDLATKNVEFIQSELIRSGTLLRIANGETQGFLEDYGAVIKGFIDYYESTFNEELLHLARKLTNTVIDSFFDEKEGFFYYSAVNSEELIARKKELFDNVIPSSNSIMANNLYRLGIMLDHSDYQDKASNMVEKVIHMIKQEPEYLSNWGITAMMMSKPTAEILVVGDQALEIAAALNEEFIRNKVIMATSETSDLPLFSYKESLNGQTTIYVCYNKTCRQPVFEVAAALNEINDL